MIMIPRSACSYGQLAGTLRGCGPAPRSSAAHPQRLRDMIGPAVLEEKRGKGQGRARADSGRDERRAPTAQKAAAGSTLPPWRAVVSAG